jgi:hypothetical protein
VRRSPSLADALRAALVQDDHLRASTLVREAVAASPSGALADPVVRDWVARRYRWLFVRAAEQDEQAVAAAATVLGVRVRSVAVDRRRLYERFFVGVTPVEAELDQPDADPRGLGDVTLVFCPGLITGLLPVLAFQQAFPAVAADLGVPIRLADSHPMRSSRANAADLADVVDRGLGQAADAQPISEPQPVGDFVLVGYSKGVPDALELLVDRPDLRDRCRGLVSLAGVVGGAFNADDIYPLFTRRGLPRSPFDATLLDALTRLAPVVRLDRMTRRLDQYDISGAVRSVTTAERQGFLAEHRPEDWGIPLFSISGATRLFEVPVVQTQSFLAVSRRDPVNDMQLTVPQSSFASGLHLATHHAHHWDLVYPPFPLVARVAGPNLDHRFPSECLLRALVLLLHEIGLL